MKTRILLLTAALFAILGYLLWIYRGSGRNVYAVDQPGSGLACSGGTQFAVIGDYGDAGRPAADVAEMVNQWQPDFIVTLGDNNYPNGAAGTIDENIGRYFSRHIHPYKGQYGTGAAANRFYPALGNHDWRTAGAAPYLDYFTLPGNERYYDIVQGNLHLFILDSNREEPDGRAADSVQAQWLSARMAASGARWKIVVLHHPPYSSGRKHGSQPVVQWDFAALGADAVLAGHEHLYERLLIDGLPYIVNGLGGRQKIYPFAAPLPGSAVRYNQEYGAMRVTAGSGCLNFSFYNRAGILIDSETIMHAAPSDP